MSDKNAHFVKEWAFHSAREYQMGEACVWAGVWMLVAVCAKP